MDEIRDAARIARAEPRAVVAEIGRLEDAYARVKAASAAGGLKSLTDAKKPRRRGATNLHPIAAPGCDDSAIEPGRTPHMRRSLPLALLTALVLSVPAAHAAGQARLLGRAVLPARTFAPGPPSGTLLGTAPINGVRPPFGSQPVQGFSAALPAGHGRYWVMPDNGYGSIESSADFNLRVYLIRPHFETTHGGSGRVSVVRFFQLHDPDHKVPFALVNNWTRDRVLTGADFDIESMQRARDGSLWFGDEFGPFLLHTDAHGRVLHAPYRLPDPTTGARSCARRRTRSRRSRARCA